MKKRTSKEIFAETLLELAEERPVDKITVKQIVEESGLSLKTFYNHFRDKYALMIYIPEAIAASLIEKLEGGDYSYPDFLLDGVKAYFSFGYYYINAGVNTSGQDSFEKKYATTFYRAHIAFLLRRNNLSSVPEEIEFALRLYLYGLIEMYSSVFLYGEGMDTDRFIRLCLEDMPEKLKPYLL